MQRIIKVTQLNDAALDNRHGDEVESRAAEEGIVSKGRRVEAATTIY